jgi:hypothetical protein
VTGPLLLVIGLVAGVIAAGLGVGGGIIFVPALVLFLDYPQQLAQGTSLAVILPTAVVGAIVHARRGRVIGKLALPIASAGVVGALLGAGLALQLDGLLLRRLFATLLVILALRLLWQTRHGDSSPVDGHVHDAGS